VSPIAGVFLLMGAAIALLAGIGLVRFQTSYARFHAAGKASPIAFFLVSIGAAFELGLMGALELLVAAVALLLTLPASTHLLFRATHRTTVSDHLSRDDLLAAERELDAAVADGSADDTVDPGSS
jgi:multicomponent Na+:H+ antiporter subunit G